MTRIRALNRTVNEIACSKGKLEVLFATGIDHSGERIASRRVKVDFGSEEMRGKRLRV